VAIPVRIADTIRFRASLIAVIISNANSRGHNHNNNNKNNNNDGDSSGGNKQIYFVIAKIGRRAI